MLDLQGELTKKAEQEQLDQILSSLGISPMKTHGLPKSTKTNIVQGNLEQVLRNKKILLPALMFQR